MWKKDLSPYIQCKWVLSNSSQWYFLGYPQHCCSLHKCILRHPALGCFWIQLHFVLYFARERNHNKMSDLQYAKSLISRDQRGSALKSNCHLEFLAIQATLSSWIHKLSLHGRVVNHAVNNFLRFYASHSWSSVRKQFDYWNLVSHLLSRVHNPISSPDHIRVRISSCFTH